MAQTPIVEGNHAGAHLVEVPTLAITRKKITLLSDQNLKAGAVLGKITIGGKYKELNPAATDGSEVAAGILFDNEHADGADKEVLADLRHFVANKQEVVWKAGMTAGEITTATAELDALSIVLC